MRNLYNKLNALLSQHESPMAIEWAVLVVVFILIAVTMITSFGRATAGSVVAPQPTVSQTTAVR